MVFLSRLSRFVWLPFSCALFLVVLVFSISSGKAIIAFVPLSLFCIPLGIIVAQRFFPEMVWYSLPVYFFIIFQFLFWSLGIAFIHYALGCILLLLPIFIIESFYRGGNKGIPGIGALSILLLGFAISQVHQLIVFPGAGNYPFGYDLFFLLAIASFFAIYFLLRLNIITLRLTLIALCFSGLPIIGIILFRYVELGKLSSIFTERFGISAEISPNFLSSFLDIIFPLSLFIALKEKKIQLKILLLSIAVLYGLCLLATATRGSIPGVLLLIAYFSFKSKSAVRFFLVIITAIIAGWFFGGKTIMRLIAPDRIDIISNVGRIELMRAGFKVLKEHHFFFGIGMDNYKIEKFTHGFPIWFDPTKGMSSHNTHLEMWIGWGLVGLVGWLYLLIGSIIHAARIKPSSENSALSAPLILAVMAFFFHGFFDSIIGLFPFLLHIFCLLACISFLVSQERIGNAIRPDRVD